MIKKTIIILLGLGVFIGIFIYSMDWGTVKSEIKKSEIEVITEDVSVPEGQGLDLMTVGNYKSSHANNDNLELLFNIEGLKKTTGRFDDVSVEMQIIDNKKDSKLNIVIQVSSIFTNNKMRDESLVSAEYFDAVKFPTIEFNSKTIVMGDTSLIATGELLFLGQINELEFPLDLIGTGINSNNENFTAFEGQFDFDKTKYGMPEESGIGNVVHVTFYCELLLK